MQKVDPDELLVFLRNGDRLHVPQGSASHIQGNVGLDFPRPSPLFVDLPPVQFPGCLNPLFASQFPHSAQKMVKMTAQASVSVIWKPRSISIRTTAQAVVAKPSTINRSRATAMAVASWNVNISIPASMFLILSVRSNGCLAGSPPRYFTRPLFVLPTIINGPLGITPRPKVNFSGSLANSSRPVTRICCCNHKA